MRLNNSTIQQIGTAKKFKKIGRHEFESFDDWQFFVWIIRAVAILCNHQRSVPKQHESSMDKMKTQLSKLEEDIKELNVCEEYTLCREYVSKIVGRIKRRRCKELFIY